MTNEKELSKLIEQVRSLGATVNVKFDGQGFYSEIQIIGLKGVGSHPVTGMIAAAEIMRAALSGPIQVRVPFVNQVETFQPVGIGAYPYECISKDKHPNSMIYVSEAYGNGWIASHQLIDTGLGYFELGVA